MQPASLGLYAIARCVAPIVWKKSCSRPIRLSPGYDEPITFCGKCYECMVSSHRSGIWITQ